MLGVPVARLLPVLLLLCECSLTAETALDVGVVDGPHRGACRACPRSSAFVALSSAGGRLEDLSGASCPRRGFVPTTALVVGSTHLLRGLVDRAWRGGVSRSLLAAHAGGFGSRSQTARKCSKTATVKAPVWSKSLQEVLGDASHYSAQERRMLGALSKFGRLHGRAAPADTPNGKAAGVNGQTVREQKEEMAKERRDEKLSLRRRQGSHPHNDFSPPLSPPHTLHFYRCVHSSVFF